MPKEIYKVMESLWEREEKGDVVILVSPRDLGVVITPTNLIARSAELDKFLRMLLPDVEADYRLDAADSPWDRVGGLSYPRLDWLSPDWGRSSLRLMPDYQLAQTVVDWETGIVEKRHSVTPSLEDLATGLSKAQLVALRKDPFEFNQGLRRYVERKKSMAPDYSFLPIGRVQQRPIIPGVKGLI